MAAQRTQTRNYPQPEIEAEGLRQPWPLPFHLKQIISNE
jgi:hypothetical protein